MTDRSERQTNDVTMSDPQADEYGRVEPETPATTDTGKANDVDSPEYAHEKDDD
jgi:hypothetical protein